ncbi:hypothetical protein RRG08_009967 [Elysia crispata]|uniref:Uncharacterized protein n=1 Tax=Elysia crispata TaxID=231223 RepID=A0AAE1E9J7_9GAST|nr:hypothetical protein RRG08_009967 [Elysia crispata]
MSLHITSISPITTVRSVATRTLSTLRSIARSVEQPHNDSSACQLHRKLEKLEAAAESQYFHYKETHVAI